MSERVFEYVFSIRLHDTDAAGRLFFAHLFRHAHDAYEAFMAGIGFPLDRLIREGQILLPLTHAEADYRRPLAHGDCVRVLVRVAELRDRSFAMDYRFLDSRGELAATASTVHVIVSENAAAAASLPPPLHAALAACRPSEGARNTL